MKASKQTLSSNFSSFLTQHSQFGSTAEVSSLVVGHIDTRLQEKLLNLSALTAINRLFFQIHCKHLTVHTYISFRGNAPTKLNLDIIKLLI